MINCLISIVVPTFNSEFYLREMLDSLAIQTYKNFEVIISDGGSNDDTLNIIKEYPMLKIFLDSRRDLGACDAINRGFELASGDILCWLNSDDFYLSKFSLFHISKAFQDSSVQFAYGHSLVVDNEGYVLNKLYAHRPLKGFETYGINLMTGSLFFRRECWTSFGGFSLKFKLAFEYELIYFLFKSYRNVFLIDSFLAGFRVHENGLSSKYKKLLSQECELIFKDRKIRNVVIIKLERYYSQVAQGTFFKSVFDKVFNLDKGKFWKEVFN